MIEKKYRKYHLEFEPEGFLFDDPDKLDYLWALIYEGTLMMDESHPETVNVVYYQLGEDEG